MCVCVYVCACVCVCETYRRVALIVISIRKKKRELYKGFQTGGGEIKTRIR